MTLRGVRALAQGGKATTYNEKLRQIGHKSNT